MNMLGAQKRKRILSVMPTYQCTAACTHCGTFSNPKPSHPRLLESAVMDAIEQAKEAAYEGVVFTGGEPTLALDVTLRGIRLASSFGLGTRLITNGSWAASVEDAEALTGRLKEAGLTEINFSTGDEHLRFVPFAHIVNATRAALQSGIQRICIMIEVTAHAAFESRHITEDEDFRSLMHEFPRAPVLVIESPWMPTRYDRVEEYPAALLVNKNNLESRSGCDSCLGTTTVQADGRIAACCGLGMRTIPELQLGHMSGTTLSEADRRGDDDFLKRWIRLEGPEKILAWAADYDNSIVWENTYAHKCQACLRIYKDPKVRDVILEHHQEKFADVVLGEFLLGHFAGASGAAPERTNDVVAVES